MTQWVEGETAPFSYGIHHRFELSAGLEDGSELARDVEAACSHEEYVDFSGGSSLTMLDLPRFYLPSQADPFFDRIYSPGAYMTDKVCTESNRSFVMYKAGKKKPISEWKTGR